MHKSEHLIWANTLQISIENVWAVNELSQGLSEKAILPLLKLNHIMLITFGLVN